MEPKQSNETSERSEQGPVTEATSAPVEAAPESAQVKRRGFAAMDKETQRALASRGGKSAHSRGTAHQFRGDEAREAGRKGGRSVARDREYMSRIGREGARKSAEVRRKKPVAA